jgi:hypothetical protein
LINTVKRQDEFLFQFFSSWRCRIFLLINNLSQQMLSRTFYILSPLSSAEPYEFLVKLRNITWETNYVIVSQNALGMMGRRKLTPRRAQLNVLYYPYIIPTILYDSAEESGSAK